MRVQFALKELEVDLPSFKPIADYKQLKAKTLGSKKTAVLINAD